MEGVNEVEMLGIVMLIVMKRVVIIKMKWRRMEMIMMSDNDDDK